MLASVPLKGTCLSMARMRRRFFTAAGMITNDSLVKTQSILVSVGPGWLRIAHPINTKLDWITAAEISLRPSCLCKIKHFLRVGMEIGQ